MRISKLSQALLATSLAPLMLIGCGSGDEKNTGVFSGVPVSGLNYQGSNTLAATTSSDGSFEYEDSEVITFSIGQLGLGSAEGDDVLTVLSITENAESETDQVVNNKLVLLQTLDADGNLNNGIQLTETIRNTVSDQAANIDFDQSTSDFSSSIAPLVAMLEEAQAFSDTDPRSRKVMDPQDAIEHFTRSISKRIVVNTSEGQLSGFEANETTWQFLGVPYAKPPLGDLRWRAPEDAQPWSGVRDALAWGDQSAQTLTYEKYANGGMSEDSLYMNITAPKNAENLPVMVWFHGGAFTILTANSNQYNNPNSLTTKDVVLVTVNHRLGPFGYLAHPLLTAESGYNGSGNYGQMDLVKALQWIQDNIRAFGGNPESVTIFGQSGGGGKTYSLMNSPQATGLFHKAIVQSGFATMDSSRTAAESLTEAEAIGSALFQRNNVTTLEEARALTWTDIVNTDSANSIPREIYRPNVDYAYMSKTYYENVVDGMPSDVPLMSGATSGDYSTLRSALPIWLNQRSPTYLSNQYVYKFSRMPNGWSAQGVKSCHGCELPYVFNYKNGFVQNYLFNLIVDADGQKLEIGDLNGNGVSGSNGDAIDVFLSAGYGTDDVEYTEQTMTMWTNFAKTGDPSTSTLSWPTYSVENDTFVEIGSENGIEVKTGLQAALQ